MRSRSAARRRATDRAVLVGRASASIWEVSAKALPSIGPKNCSPDLASTPRLLSAGTSSILAVGRPAAGAAWTVDVRHPADDDAEPIGRLELVDRSLSCSATVRPGQAVSDVVDPHTGLPLAGGEAVVVLAAERRRRPRRCRRHFWRWAAAGPRNILPARIRLN